MTAELIDGAWERRNAERKKLQEIGAKAHELIDRYIADRIATVDARYDQAIDEGLRESRSEESRPQGTV